MAAAEAAHSASIGVVVPNRNYARYLPERLHSILGQHRAPANLIFLDDGSTDGSWDVAHAILASQPVPFAMHRNDTPSGSVLGQWRAGLAQLENDLVWIAEADDAAEPGMLGALAARLEADPRAVFAFCDSVPIGAAGERLAADSKAYYEIEGGNPLAADAVFDATAFLQHCLCPRNMVVNASAVLWRAATLRKALAAMEREMPRWLCAGDWRCYAEACAGLGTVHYLAAPLNLHRRHAGSVTRSTRWARHYAEVVLMEATLRTRLGPDAGRDAAMRAHLHDLRDAWGLEPAGTAATLADAASTPAAAPAVAPAPAPAPESGPEAPPREPPAPPDAEEMAEVWNIPAEALRGPGLYDLEGAGTAAWRWLHPQATILLDGVPAAAGTALLDIASLAPGLSGTAVAGLANGVTTTGYFEETESGTVLRVPLPHGAVRRDRSLRLGLNFERFFTPAGDERVIAAACIGVRFES